MSAKVTTMPAIRLKTTPRDVAEDWAKFIYDRPEGSVLELDLANWIEQAAKDYQEVKEKE